MKNANSHTIERLLSLSLFQKLKANQKDVHMCSSSWILHTNTKLEIRIMQRIDPTMTIKSRVGKRNGISLQVYNYLTVHVSCKDPPWLFLKCEQLKKCLFKF